MLSFEELTEARRKLQSFCRLHVPSLMMVRSGISFRKLMKTETKDLDDSEFHHPTTTATCLISLFDCPPGYRTTEFKDADEIRKKISEAALRRPWEKWASEGSAGIYCRCRALPMVIRFLSSFDPKVERHLGEILGQLKTKPERFGIGEASTELPEDEWYPPNAFHTYWTLEVLDLLKSRFRSEYDRLSSPAALDLARKADGMRVWARKQLGTQLGLHSGSPPSSVLDSDQLAWSLAIFLHFDTTLNMDLEHRDLIKQALTCLFSTQADGTWRHYKPLFHYKRAGNAYCYVFETFAALLECALQERPEAEMIRDLLKPHCSKLMDLWRYADSTKIPLSRDGTKIGWCSGHRTNVTEPESWATASVFSYAQFLRRLIGIWCREEALASRRSPISRGSREDAARDFVDRGKTWEVKKDPVSERLWTLFVNPVRMHDCTVGCTDRLEPDSQPVEENQARSAILFGPPGTSKTTLVRLLADVIEWDYVEIHASHFVAEGLPEVQRTADKIFKQLSELDHAVVLFDEIDELVREREMEEDAFGRFLTTSMLPKLAELWKARNILYFVATNHINYFDSAIIRSHRFDALILVSPPSFEAKIKGLEKLLSKTHQVAVRFEGITKQHIQDALQKVVDSAPKPDENLGPELALAKFALLRWDELDELALRLKGILSGASSDPKTISADILRQALEEVADSQWRKNKSYLEYVRDTKSERRDYQMLNVWEVKGALDPSVPGVVVANGLRWLRNAADSIADVSIPGFELIHAPLGGIEVRVVTK